MVGVIESVNVGTPRGISWRGRTVRTASLSQVRQPVYKRSVRRWKNYEPALKPLFDLLDRPA